MCKRLWMICVVGFFLVGLLAPNVNAICRIPGKCLMTCSQLCMDMFIKGAGNPDVNALKVCGGIYIDTVSGQCWNNPYNSNSAQGTVFHPGINVTTSAQVTSLDLATLDIHGWADLSGMLCFEGGGTEALNAAIFNWLNDQDYCANLTNPPSGSTCRETTIDAAFCDNQSSLAKDCQYCQNSKGKWICPNNNWWYDPCSSKIDVLYAYYSAWQSKGTTGPLSLSDDQCYRCVPTTNPETSECGFDCTQVDSSECTKNPRLMDQACSDCVNKSVCYSPTTP
jgi:hypothetical protein